MSKTIHIALTLLAALLLALPAVAQEQQQNANKRHITPVKPETNTTLRPAKGTDEKIIQQYLSGDTAAAKAQERRDSLAKIYPHYPALTQLVVGVNFLDPVLMAFGQKHASVDASIGINLWNRLEPVLELGLGWSDDTPDDMNYHYKGKPAPYARLGANYNMTFKKSPAYNAHVGFRVGYSSFKYDVLDVTVPDGYWGDNGTFSLTGIKSHALWGDFLVGLRVQLKGPWAMGWDARYRAIFDYGKTDNGRPWHIPGYGLRQRKFAFTMSLYYTLPLSRDRWPKADDKTKQK